MQKANLRENDLSCRHVNIEMDYPRTRADAEAFLYYLYHRRTRVYIAKSGDWFLLVPSRCAHLKTGNRCAIEGRQLEYCTQHQHIKTKNIADIARRVFSTERQFLGYLKKHRPALFKKLPAATRRVVGG